MRWPRKRTIAIVAVVTLAAAAVLAYTLPRVMDRGTRVAAEQRWTCPMHPEVREKGPGKCPKCGMDLVLETAATVAGGLTQGQAAGAEYSSEPQRAGVQIDLRRRQLAGVRTVAAQRSELTRSVRAVGIVRYDETRLTDVNLKLEGWARKLHADYTGEFVRQGQPLLDLYSPDLLATANEYLLALSTRDAMQDSQVADARTQADRLVESARQRLLLWDIGAQDLRRLEETRRADASVTFRSPVTGYIIEKPVVEGMKVMAGQTLYRIADLSSVWIEADIYESDAPFVKTGARAAVTIDAYPDERLSGRVTYIYPFVEEKTRTIKARFAFPNPRLRLKPGMYANVELETSLGGGVTVPADAVLDSGSEQTVFVALGEGYFEPRVVRAGVRSNGQVQIVSGLKAGEHVAAGAAFFLDSESQLRAAAGGWTPPQSDAPSTTGSVGPQASIAFRVEHAPRSGDNQVGAVLKDASGAALTDATVDVLFYMPPMPSMNMPAMRAESHLAHAGGGEYRGRVSVPHAGRWDVTVTATRNGRRVAVQQTTVVTQ